MNIEYLRNRGFENRQISQLVFIDELGLDLSMINIDVPIDTLKDFKNRIINGEIEECNLNVFKSLVKNDANITNLLSGEFDQDKIRTLVWFASNRFDILNISKQEYDNNKLEALFKIYRNTKQAFPILEESDVSKDDLSLLAYLAEEGVDVKTGLEKVNNFEELRVITKLLSYCKCSHLKTPDLTILNDNTYNENQKFEILTGLAKGVDITKFCNATFNEEQMKVIKYGLTQDLDVTIYNKKRYNDKQMYKIYEFLLAIKSGDAHFDIDLICNAKYSPAVMEFLSKRLMKNEDISLYTKFDYDINQMNMLFLGKKRGLDTTIYENPDIPAKEMFVIYNCLRLKEQGADINDMNKEKTIESKIQYLMDFTSLGDLRSIDILDVKLDDRMDKINNYYCNKTRKNIYFYKADDDKTLVLERNGDVEHPDYFFEIDDSEDRPIEECLGYEYNNEIRDIIELMGFIEVSDNNEGSVENLYTGFGEMFISPDIMDYDIDEIINIIIERSFYYLETGEYRASSLFETIDDLERWFTVDIDSLFWKYRIDEFSQFTYITEKMLREKDIEFDTESLKEAYAKFAEDSENLYAFWDDDIYCAKLFDKDFKLLSKGTVYGTFNVEDKLINLFNLKKVDPIVDEKECFDIELSI